MSQENQETNQAPPIHWADWAFAPQRFLPALVLMGLLAWGGYEFFRPYEKGDSVPGLSGVKVGDTIRVPNFYAKPIYRPHDTLNSGGTREAVITIRGYEDGQISGWALWVRREVFAEVKAIREKGYQVEKSIGGL